MRLDLPISQNHRLLERANGLWKLPLKEVCIAQVGVSLVRGLKADSLLQRMLGLWILSRDQIRSAQAGPVSSTIGGQCHRFFVLFGGLSVACFLGIQAAEPRVIRWDFGMCLDCRLIGLLAELHTAKVLMGRGYSSIGNVVARIGVARH